MKTGREFVLVSLLGVGGWVGRVSMFRHTRWQGGSVWKCGFFSMRSDGVWVLGGKVKLFFDVYLLFCIYTC